MKHLCNKNVWLHFLGMTIFMVGPVVRLADASQLRLVGGRTASLGRLEIYLGFQWGTVCDDDWELQDAKVACRQLGFPGAAKATQGGYFDSGTGTINLDDVDCDGSESDLASCQHRGVGSHNCGHSEDAGVICSTRVRLMEGDDPKEGRVEVYWSDEWGTVCDDSWDLNDATVICRELGYGGALQALGSAAFCQGDGLDFLLDDVACTGNETTVFDCPRSEFGLENCDHRAEFGVALSVL